MARTGLHRDLHRGPTTSLNFHDFIEKRDYVGALAVLDFDGGTITSEPEQKLWRAYCLFQLGQYERAREIYSDLHSGETNDVPDDIGLYLACVYFFLGRYRDSEEVALSVEGGDPELKNRILLHAACKNDDETKVAKYRQDLTTSIEDQISAAAVEFSFRRRYQESDNVCKTILSEEKDALALYVYIAMCLFKMGYYDVSMENLSIYGEAYPDSTVVNNLKACNAFMLCNGPTALQELTNSFNEKLRNENDLLRHNTVVFTGGEKALQVLPSLIDKIPEAKLNLAIYYLRLGEIDAAAELMEEFEANSPESHIVLGTIHAEIGQMTGSEEDIQRSQKHFDVVGNSPNECDTIPGRLSMASSLFLQQNYNDAIEVFDSVQRILGNTDDFKWNYGVCLAASGNYEDGLDVLMTLSQESFKSDLSMWIAKCYIMTNNPESAWGLYLNTNDPEKELDLLMLIAEESYKLGGFQFFYAAKAFSSLLKLEESTSFMDGAIGASVGYFRHCIYVKSQRNASENHSEKLTEIVDILVKLESPKSTRIAGIISTWNDNQ